MEVETLLVGGTTNCYLAYDENKNGFIVDPGAESEKILAHIDHLNVKIEGILLTHAHGDHISALNKVRDALDVKVYMHKNELENYLSQSPQFVAMLGGELPDRNPDVLLEDGEVIHFRAGDVQVIFTPGHTPGGTCYMYGDILFSGDTLFQGSIGRTDFPGGDTSAIMNSLVKLSKLDDDLRVLSGHGLPTTIGMEKRTNPFMRQVL
ncbi:MAG: MBL fold metallo-hydrolase [Peptoniphilus sp.]|nr:MBL fold metallo-hydrolase [Peptoniphilus sp.]MDY3119187.1 MBL fold metallo-hydrolase [Peptoniphilus sp.]